MFKFFKVSSNGYLKISTVDVQVKFTSSTAVNESHTKPATEITKASNIGCFCKKNKRVRRVKGMINLGC